MLANRPRGASLANFHRVLHRSSVVIACILATSLALARSSAASDDPPRRATLPEALAEQRQHAPVHAVTLTLDLQTVALGLDSVFWLGPGSLALRGRSEIGLGPLFSVALSVGGGGRPKGVAGTPANQTTFAWDAGLEGRYYLVGNFEGGLYLDAQATFVHALDTVGYGWPFLPPGLAAGPGVGVKMPHVPILGTIDLGAALLIPLATPSREGPAPPVVPATFFGVGGSF